MVRVLPVNQLQEYTKNWATKQFDFEHATAIANIISKYSKYNGRRKPGIQVTANNKLINAGSNTFVKSNGYISIEAAHFAKAVDAGNIAWKVLPDYGRTSDGITTFPVTAAKQTPGKDSPHLEYSIFVTDSGTVKVDAYISPTIDFTNSGGLHYAVFIDGEQPQIINIHQKNTEADWRKSVADNIRILTSTHQIKKPGQHVLNFWMVDPCVVLQKLVLDFGGLQHSYLGPPESYRNTK